MTNATIANAAKITYSKWDNFNDNGQPGGTKTVFADGVDIGYIEKHYDNHSSDFQVLKTAWQVVAYEWNPTAMDKESFFTNVPESRVTGQARTNTTRDTYKRFIGRLVDSIA